MKQIIIIVILVVSFSSCQQQQKIGFIDTGEIVNEYQEKVDLEAKFKKRGETIQRRVDSLKQAFNIELNAAQIKASKLNPQGAKMQKLSQEIQQKEGLMNQRIQMESQQYQQAFQTELDSVIVKVKDFAKEYGKTNGYAFVLGTSEATSSVIYGEDASDLTKTILDALNAKYKE